MNRIVFRFALAVAFASAACASGKTRADVITGLGTGYNVSVELSLELLDAPAVSATVGPTSFSTISAPPPGADSDSVASLSVSLGSIPLVGTLLSLETGLLTSSATSDVDGLGALATTSADASVEGLTLNVLELLLFPNVLSINADAITSAAEVNGGYGALTGGATTNFANLTISLLGTEVATVDGSVAANTEIDVSSLLGGVTIVLNEQIAVGDGISSLGFLTNAIRISLDNVGISGLGTLNGSVIISHAEASQVAVVPEPSSLALCGPATLLGLVWWRRRRRAA